MCVGQRQHCAVKERSSLMNFVLYVPPELRQMLMEHLGNVRNNVGTWSRGQNPLVHLNGYGGGLLALRQACKISFKMELPCNRKVRLTQFQLWILYHQNVHVRQLVLQPCPDVFDTRHEIFSHELVENICEEELMDFQCERDDGLCDFKGDENPHPPKPPLPPTHTLSLP